jgi:hypothetical protein
MDVTKHSLTKLYEDQSISLEVKANKANFSIFKMAAAASLNFTDKILVR